MNLLASGLKMTVFGFFLLLASCASVPLTSMPKLASIKPETMDLSSLEMAVRLPKTVGIRKDSATLKVYMRNNASGKIIKQTMVLSDPNPELTRFLQKQEKSVYKVHRFKMTEQQLANAEAFRRDAMALRMDVGGKNEMTLNASVGFCQYEMGPQLSQITMKFYVKTKPGKDFFTLFKEQSINLEQSAEDKDKKRRDPVYCGDK